MVKDISAGIDGGDPRLITNVNGTLFFRANDGIHGPEVWKSDGTQQGTMLVKDIALGSSSADPSGFTAIGHPGPRFSSYVHKLRKAEFSIETITEAHGGPFAGKHARYVLRETTVIEDHEVQA